MISIWPKCWNSSSRMCSSTAPLDSVYGTGSSGSRRTLTGARRRRRGRRGPRGAVGRACSVRRSSPATSPLARELGGAVALDRPLGDRGAAPVLHDAEAVGQDHVGGVAAAERGAPVDQLVAELLDDGGHLPDAPGRRTTGSPGRDGDGSGALAVSGRPRHRGRSRASARAAGSLPEITSVRVTFSSTERRLARTATQTCWRFSAAPS